MTRPPIRIQLQRTKGWRMPPNTVKVDRSTKWGNPFVVGSQVIMPSGARPMSPAEAVDLYRRWITRIDTPDERATIEESGLLAIDLVDITRALRGKDLACWCKPGAPCHADVLLEIANR